MNLKGLSLPLEVVLRDGIDAEGWSIYRIAPKELNDDLFVSMLKRHTPPECGRYMWLVGREVGQRLHNRNILGSPREFVHAEFGWDKIIGHACSIPVWAFESEDKCRPDLLRLVVIDANDEVIDTSAYWIDTNLEK